MNDFERRKLMDSLNAWIALIQWDALTPEQRDSILVRAHELRNQIAYVVSCKEEVPA